MTDAVINGRMDSVITKLCVYFPVRIYSKADMMPSTMAAPRQTMTGTRLRADVFRIELSNVMNLLYMIQRDTGRRTNIAGIAFTIFGKMDLADIQIPE